MIVTLTSKGQLTLPKAIRDQMKLDAGSKLDFHMLSDGTLAARPLTRKVADLAGILHRPGLPPTTVEQMNEARDRYLAGKHERIVGTGTSAITGQASRKPRR